MHFFLFAYSPKSSGMHEFRTVTKHQRQKCLVTRSNEHLPANENRELSVAMAKILNKC